MRINITTTEVIEMLSTYDDTPHPSAITAIVNYLDDTWEECDFITLSDMVRFRSTVYSDDKSISDFSISDLIDEFGDLYPFKEYVRLYGPNLSGEQYVGELIKAIDTVWTVVEFPYGYIVIQ